MLKRKWIEARRVGLVARVIRPVKYGCHAAALTFCALRERLRAGEHIDDAAEWPACAQPVPAATFMFAFISLNAVNGKLNIR